MYCFSTRGAEKAMVTLACEVSLRQAAPTAPQAASETVLQGVMLGVGM